VFAGAPFRWWFAGGHALEVHLGARWRDHEDIDVGICRADTPGVFTWLDGWDLAVASKGALTDWAGERLGDGQNNIWCHRSGAAAWQLDISVGAGDDSSWRYRRDVSISRPWGSAVLRTTGGVPYLAPELQLLFKSKDPRPKDDEDAAFVIPRLDGARQQALRTLLPARHRWQRLLGTAPAS
jgi:hypothetical protein